MVSKSLNDLLVRFNLRCHVLLRLHHQFIRDNFALVKCGRLQLAPFLQRAHDALVLPTDLVRESAECTVLAPWLEAQHAKCGWDNDALLFVIWGWDSLKNFQALHCILAAIQLVWQHTPDRPPEDLAGGAEVEGSSLRITVVSLLEEIQVLQFVTVEVTGDIDTFTSHYDDSLTLQKSLGDNSREATK